MNFSVLPTNKSIVGKIIRIPLKFIPPIQIPILQGKLKGKKWIVGSSVHGCWLGGYEYKKRILFEKIVKKGSCVFDIGANVGFYTLLSSELVGPKGTVISFEPLPRNIYFLKKHLRINKLTNVKIIEAAVSDSSGIKYFEPSPSPSMAHLSKRGDLKVKTVSLDKLILKDKVPSPQYMKIDVEGAEMNVLLGAESILKNIHPIIFLATHGGYIHKKCIKFLQSLDYHFEPIIWDNINAQEEIFAY